MIAKEQESVEELAEEIWALREAGENTFQRVAGGSKLIDAGEVLDRMIHQGLASASGDHVELTAMGEEIARKTIRRHRLAEILLSQVFDIREDLTNTTACELEHILSEEVTDSVCSFLGHPPHCPHGKPIPRGDCCDLFQREIQPLVVPLTQLGVGRKGRIVFISQDARQSLEQLAAMGIIPGEIVSLKQNYPSLVLQVEQSTIALDGHIGRGVFVRPLTKGTARKR